MKLYIATVWWDFMDEDPEIFTHPDEKEVDKLVRTKLAAEYWDGEIGLDYDTTNALDQIGGRVVFDSLDIPGFSIIATDLLGDAVNIIHDNINDLEMDEMQSDNENGGWIPKALANAKSIRDQVIELLNNE